MNVFRNHAEIGFVAGNMVMERTLPKAFIKRYSLSAFDKADVLNGRISLERHWTAGYWTMISRKSRVAMRADMESAPTGARFGPNNILRWCVHIVIK